MKPFVWAFNIQQIFIIMGKLKSRLFLWIERTLARCTDRIVCISKAELESALRNNIVERDKLDVILNGIDIQAIAETIPFTRGELEIPEDAFLVGMVGRISPQKAPDTFIKAAKLIKERIPEAWFMIVGDGEQREEIELYAKENNIPLHITGWTETPYRYMKMFDVGLLLSRWEGFGLVLAEYMAAGKNFVATRVDAIPTIVQDGIDGVLVEVDNPAQAADAVWKLYSDKGLAARLKENATKSVHEKFDVRRVAEQHVKLFNEVMNT